MPAILVYFLIGFATGLRSFTPLGAISWATHVGWLQFASTKLRLIGHRPAVALLTLLALSELFIDKLPQTPARTEAVGLITRIILACLCAVVIAIASSGSVVLAAIVGIIGALGGTFAGYNARRLFATRSGIPDFAVALAEDVIAIAGSLLIVSHVG